MPIETRAWSNGAVFRGSVRAALATAEASSGPSLSGVKRSSSIPARSANDGYAACANASIVLGRTGSSLLMLVPRGSRKARRKANAKRRSDEANERLIIAPDPKPEGPSFISKRAQHAAQVFLVFDDEDALGHAAVAFPSSARVGSSIWKVEPLPTVDTTQMRPPCISTICLAMARPRPVPPLDLVLELST